MEDFTILSNDELMMTLRKKEEAYQDYDESLRKAIHEEELQETEVEAEFSRLSMQRDEHRDNPEYLRLLDDQYQCLNEMKNKQKSLIDYARLERKKVAQTHETEVKAIKQLLKEREGA